MPSAPQSSNEQEQEEENEEENEDGSPEDEDDSEEEEDDSDAPESPKVELPDRATRGNRMGQVLAFSTVCQVDSFKAGGIGFSSRIQVSTAAPAA